MALYTRKDKKKPQTRSLALVLLAWVFIGGQVLLAAGSIFNYHEEEVGPDQEPAGWQLLGQGAIKMRMIAAQAEPDTISSIALFLAVANALGIAALMCALLSWSRSGHLSGRLTIAAAVTIILINSILILPYV